MKWDTSVFIQKATEVHGDKYDYSKVVYTHNKMYLTIICKNHGEFQQTAYKHIYGAGCRKCADDKHGDKLRKTTERQAEEQAEATRW